MNKLKAIFLFFICFAIVAAERKLSTFSLLNKYPLSEIKERLRPSSIRAPKKEQGITEHQSLERTVRHSPDDDRVFPLETVLMKSFDADLQSNLDTASIHIGASANQNCVKWQREEEDFFAETF
jgi:hypothetical protein